MKWYLLPSVHQGFSQILLADDDFFKAAYKPLTSSLTQYHTIVAPHPLKQYRGDGGFLNYHG